MSHQLVLVTGGSGFIGHAVIKELLQEGYRVRSFVRTAPALSADHSNLTYAIGDVRDLKSLEAAMAGVEYVIHLAAAKNDERDSKAINVGGAKNMVEACRIVGVKRIVNISTQSAKLKRKGMYGSTKEQSDLLLHASSVPVVTLRCSLIYASELSGVFGTIVRFSGLPCIPLFGLGMVTYRPMHRDDLAKVIVRAIQIPEIAGAMIDIGGPDELTFNAITQSIMDARGVRRPILHFPVWLGIAAAKILQVLPHPPITVSNVLGGAENVPMDMSAFLSAFDTLSVRPFSQGLVEVFGLTPTPEDREAAMLLSYVVSSVGQWKPDAARIALFRTALKTHHLDTSVLDCTVIRSKRSLAVFDAASRILCPQCLLQQKLIVAAAIAEVQPESADALLPQDRSTLMTFIRGVDIGISAMWTMLGAVPLLIRPRFLKYYAGAI